MLKIILHALMVEFRQMLGAIHKGFPQRGGGGCGGGGGNALRTRG